MKTFKRIIFTSVGVAVLMLSSCTTNFDEINKDPNRPSMVPTTGILTYVQRAIAGAYYDSWYGMRMNGVICQHWSQRTYTQEDRYDFAARTSSVAGYFNNTYLYIEQANQILTVLEKDNTSSLYGDPKLQKASVEIIKAFLLFQNVQTFGDVPFTQANNLTEHPTPAYDSQESIFKGLIENLKAVNTSLAGVTKGWTKGDIYFKGDVEKWRRFANSLRFVIAMRMSNVEPALSRTEAEAAIADGVMRNNGDNAVFRFVGIGSPDQSSRYGDYSSRMDFLPSWQFTNMLHGRDDDAIGFKNPFNGLFDPRLYEIAVSPEDQKDAATKPLEGMPYGLAGGDNDQVWASLAQSQRIAYGPTSGKADNVLPKPIQATTWTTLMDYPNVALFMAELQGNDRALFESGLNASMDVWGVPAERATPYVEGVMAKFDAADAEGKYEMIITQKYIHNFNHFDQESLFEYRRTEYPKCLVMPGQQSGRVYTINGQPKTFTFEPIDGSTVFLQRMYYPSTEGQYNAESLTNAIKAMGGDTQYIPLYYAKGYKK